MNRPLRPALTASIALLLLGGGISCRKPKAEASKTQGKTAASLLAEGEAQLKRGKYEEGRRTLRILEENLPSTPEFPKAKLLIADSFFYGSPTSYPEALVEYQSFLNYFPRHEMRDYALYRSALCHFAAIESAERDQAETRKALDTFQAFLKDSPGSPYAPEAKGYYQNLVESYPNSEWSRRAKDRLIEMGTLGVKEELDS